MPYQIAAVEQVKALKSYRRHLEKQNRCHIRDNNVVGRMWISTGLHAVWRRSQKKNNA